MYKVRLTVKRLEEISLDRKNTFCTKQHFVETKSRIEAFPSQLSLITTQQTSRIADVGAAAEAAANGSDGQSS